ncbi:Os10g0154200, partial [Oryza sativa Japonica Group]
ICPDSKIVVSFGYVRIDPGNAFRIVVKGAKYVADLEYEMLEMAEQRFDLWVDRCKGYSLANLRDDMASKIIWG